MINKERVKEEIDQMPDINDLQKRKKEKKRSEPTSLTGFLTITISGKGHMSKILF